MAMASVLDISIDKADNNWPTRNKCVQEEEEAPRGERERDERAELERKALRTHLECNAPATLAAAALAAAH